MVKNADKICDPLMFITHVMAKNEATQSPNNATASFRSPRF
jgi:hypothetical protein